MDEVKQVSDRRKASLEYPALILVPGTMRSVSLI